MVLDVERFLARERKIYERQLRKEKWGMGLMGFFVVCYVLAIMIGRYDFLGWFEWFVFYLALGILLYHSWGVVRLRGSIRKIDEWYLKAKYKHERGNL